MIRDVESCRSGQLAYPRIVTSSNGYVVAKYNLRPDFKRIVDRADIVDADGMPIVFASRLLCKNEIPERVATTDFVLTAAEAAVAHGTRFYFLGGKPGVAEEAASNLRALFPALQIVGIRNGYFSADEVDTICKDIREAGTDVLWVGMGSPRQEEFAVANMRKLSGVAWVRTCSPSAPMAQI
ncbi:MAG: glycosyltransferase [Sphingomonas sp.]|nr:MAG: glycosyltransferase [Sphingomonas sp.]